MIFLESFLFSSGVLLLVSLGALVTEYAGRTSLFLDGAVSLGAFLTYCFTILTHNPVSGIMLSALCCTILVIPFMFLTEKTKGNFFLASLGMNLFFSSIVSFLSISFFQTRGVSVSPQFAFNPRNARIICGIIGILISALIILMLYRTRPGLYIRVCGSHGASLEAAGINSRFYKGLTWYMGAFLASISGGFLAIRISSFVPNISAGRGWIALACIYLGRKNPLLTGFMVFLFAMAETFASYIQNIQIFQNIPSGVILAMPYLISIILITAAPGKNNQGE